MKQNQYLLASIVESSQDSIVTIDLNRIVTSWNKGAESMYGYSAEEAIGNSLERVMLPKDIQDMINKVNDIIHEMTVPIYETIRVHKNTRQADLEILLSPVRDETGKIIGISTVARDISVRKMQEQQKDDFIGVASHELKSPVTSIKAYTEILLERLERSDDETSISLARKLDKQLDRLVDLIRNLLDTTKLAAGEILLHRECFNINSLIEEQIEVLQLVSDKHTLILNTEDVLLISADRKLIGQVLTNLISNAIKYSPKGGKIIITTSETGNGIKVDVQDSGIGMPDAVREKIFDRYFRVSNPLTATSPGIGLGLFITAGIIRQHGGTISVESKEGAGSTFSFTLPYGEQHFS